MILVYTKFVLLPVNLLLFVFFASFLNRSLYPTIAMSYSKGGIKNNSNLGLV